LSCAAGRRARATQRPGAIGRAAEVARRPRSGVAPVRTAGHRLLSAPSVPSSLPTTDLAGEHGRPSPPPGGLTAKLPTNDGDHGLRLNFRKLEDLIKNIATDGRPTSRIAILFVQIFR
jgi:hypothetical protein